MQASWSRLCKFYVSFLPVLPARHAWVGMVLVGWAMMDGVYYFTSDITWNVTCNNLRPTLPQAADCSTSRFSLFRLHWSLLQDGLPWVWFVSARNKAGCHKHWCQFNIMVTIRVIIHGWLSDVVIAGRVQTCQTFAIFEKGSL